MDPGHKMRALLRTHYRSNGVHSWRSVGNFVWENNNGIKITIHCDVVISMTTLENKIMHSLAAKQLESDYNLCMHRKAPKTARGLKPQHLFATMKRALQSTKSPNIHIFGMSLEAASKYERIRFGTRIIRINNKYKLHLPMFVLKAVKCIERFGMAMSGIFIRPGEYATLCDITTSIANGLEYSFDNYYNTLEMAELLKTYFRMMPEGIFTDALEPRFLYTRELTISLRIRVLNLLVQVLPQINREALFLLMGLLFRITRNPWAQVNSFTLDHIFEPVLCRYNGNVIGERYGLIQVLIDYFPMIFGLQRKQLHAIYKQMNTLYPRKMCIHLKRRSMQCNDESSDILETLKIFHASSEELQITIQNQRQTANNLNTSSVRVPFPIRFRPFPFAELDGPAVPVGMATPVGTIGPSSSIEPNGLPGAFATSGLAEPLGPVGIAGQAGPSEPAAPIGRASASVAQQSGPAARGSAFTAVLGSIREQVVQDDIRPGEETIREDSRSTRF